MPRPNKRQQQGKKAALMRRYYQTIAKNIANTDTLLNHQSNCAQTQPNHQNVSEIRNNSLVPQSAEACSLTNGSINIKETEKPNESFVKLKKIPKHPNTYSQKKSGPHQRKIIEKTATEHILMKQCSTTPDSDGCPNDDIMERLTENCANCASNFAHKNGQNIKFKTMKSNLFSKSNEIEIIDAIFYIYGLTVADWSNTLTLDHDSDFTSASEIVFSNGITFCHKCTSVLENVYTSHKILKELAHNESLFSKTLNNKTIREVQSKIECDNENEASVLNNPGLADEEMEFKEEGDLEESFHTFDFEDSTSELNSELDELNDPLMEDELDELQFSSNISCNESVKNRFNTPSQKKQRVNKMKASLPRTKPIQSHHPFNILCCGRSFVSKELLANHQLKSHSADGEKPKLVKCNICEILIPKDKVDFHMETYYIQPWKNYFKCKVCGDQFKSASSINAHLQTHDPIYASWICEFCETPMQSDQQLIQHKRQNHYESLKKVVSKNHSESGISRACVVCEKLFSSWTSLRAHMKRMHKDKPDDYKYACIQCDTLFGSEFFLSLHREKNVDCRIVKKRSVCEKCGKSIITGHMQRHMDQHEDTECPNKDLFRCSQCGKMLKHRDSLKKHILREHPVKEKLFFCEKCGKTTKNMTNMRIHMKVHEKE